MSGLPPAGPAIVTTDLARSFGYTPVLQAVNLSIDWGERVAIFGPNGAGKTTLLRVLALHLRPHRGQLTIAGLDPWRTGPAIRRLIGVVGHQTYLYDDLTAEENLRFYGQMHDVPALPERIKAVLDQMGLLPRRRDRVRTLSRGLQQRLALARALLHDPPILLLDEPDTGLDAHAFELLRRTIVGDSRTVILTTHNIDRGRQLCERAVVLVGGRIADDGPIAQVSTAGLERVFAQAGGPRRALAGLPLSGRGATSQPQALDGSPEMPATSQPPTSDPRPSTLHGWTVSAERAPLLPLPLGEGWGEGAPCTEAAGPRAKTTLTLALSQGEREGEDDAHRIPAKRSAHEPPTPDLRYSLLRGAVSAILRKDVLLEYRTKETLSGTGVFALLVLVIFNFAFDLHVESVAAVAPGALWVAFAFAGVLGLGRSFVLERDRGSWDGLLLCPVDRGALYLGKVLANAIFIGMVELVTLPVATAIFNVPLLAPSVLLPVALGTVGFAAVGTLFAAIAANTRAREVLLPVLLFPVTMPVIIGSVKATGDALAGTGGGAWLSLLLAFDAIYLALGYVVFDFAVED